MSYSLSSLNNYPTTSILSKKTVGKTTIFFTHKALLHVLQEHSESDATPKARMQGKICFKDNSEVLKLGNQIVDELPEYLDWYRKAWSRLTKHPKENVISHLYLPTTKDWIVQLKYLSPDTFEIVSFYQKRNLKSG